MYVDEGVTYECEVAGARLPYYMNIYALYEFM